MYELSPTDIWTWKKYPDRYPTMFEISRQISGNVLSIPTNIWHWKKYPTDIWPCTKYPDEYLTLQDISPPISGNVWTIPTNIWQYHKYPDRYMCNIWRSIPRGPSLTEVPWTPTAVQKGCCSDTGGTQGTSLRFSLSHPHLGVNNEKKHKLFAMYRSTCLC
jgi:hypothetical protein